MQQQLTRDMVNHFSVFDMDYTDKESLSIKDFLAFSFNTEVATAQYVGQYLKFMYRTSKIRKCIICPKCNKFKIEATMIPAYGWFQQNVDLCYDCSINYRFSRREFEGIRIK